MPFTLSGGAFLQKLLGYNFNGAVWFSYIALSGAAVQTVVDGARLRLRPKVMTMATIVASLLPIMWSHRQGVEMMKPLATPVIGGMISRLIHILFVTPVIFL